MLFVLFKTAGKHLGCGGVIVAAGGGFYNKLAVVFGAFNAVAKYHHTAYGALAAGVGNIVRFYNLRRFRKSQKRGKFAQRGGCGGFFAHRLCQKLACV